LIVPRWRLALNVRIGSDALTVRSELIAKSVHDAAGDQWEAGL